MRKASHRRKITLHRIHTEQVLDFLDELQMLSRSSLDILRSAREHAGSPEIRPYLDNFVGRAEKGLEELVTLIRELGGNPARTGAAARIQAQRGFALSGIAAPRRLSRLCAIENCWNASVEEDVHITFLISISPYVESVHVRETMEPVLERLRKDRDSRLEWLEQTLHRLLLLRALEPLTDDDEGFPEAA